MHLHVGGGKTLLVMVLGMLCSAHASAGECSIPSPTAGEHLVGGESCLVEYQVTLAPSLTTSSLTRCAGDTTGGYEPA